MRIWSYDLNADIDLRIFSFIFFLLHFVRKLIDQVIENLIKNKDKYMRRSSAFTAMTYNQYDFVSFWIFLPHFSNKCFFQGFKREQLKS